MTATTGRLPGSLERYPRLDTWLRIDPDGTVTVFSGKVEIGQGIRTALAQIVSDELDVRYDAVRIAPVDTERSPDEGVTSGSRSIEESGQALRQVAAELRQALLERAAERHGKPVASLWTADGAVHAPDGTRLEYRELATPELLARAVTGLARPKEPRLRSVIGRVVPRIGQRDKATGAPRYVHDLELPGMLHGRVVRPPGYGATLRDLDQEAAQALPGVVAVVRDGRFLGLVAQREDLAIRALDRLRQLAQWDEHATLPAATDPRFLLDELTDDILVSDRESAVDRGRAVREHRAEYSRPYIAHAAIGPSCAVASLIDGVYTVWSHAQGVHQLRHELAKILAVPATSVRVIHADGAGCYGHNGADDAALDAALLARAVPGRPVRVQWMRDDEFAWEPYGTGMVVRIAASLDAGGDIVAWSHELWGNGHGNRPNPSLPRDAASLLASHHLSTPLRPSVPGRPRSPSSGGQRNAAPLYDFPNERVVNHYVERTPLRVSALRSLGAHANVFAIESMMDELALLSGADPIEYRLRYLRDARAREVIETAARAAAWRSGERGDGTRGRGIGFARYKNGAAYLGVIAEVELGRDIRVTRAWAAIDAGMAVSPDGIVGQTEGGITQAASWTLKEQVRFDPRRITTRGWDTYPMLTFSEAPEIEVTLIDRPDQPPLGVGEAFAGPTAAAIANAIANATGVRLRDMPLTRERLLAAVG